MTHTTYETYKERIWQLGKPLAESEGMELIYVECIKMKFRWIVRLYIDKEGGITLDDCSTISNQIGDVRDVHDIPPGPYTLEVSSPGLDRPLFRDEDFKRYRGQTVHIKLCEKIHGIRNFHGKLLDISDESDQKVLTIEMAGNIYHLPKEKLLKAHLVHETSQ
jgi:ribosome maturation factor RimP